MRKLLFAALSTIAISACHHEKNEAAYDSSKITAKDTSSAIEAPVSTNDQQCYLFTKNRDTVMMRIHVKGEEYSGDLSYRFFEKDKNKGVFGGEMKGDTLIAEYTFDSEGTRSVREVVFLKKEGKLYEGFGEVLEKEGRTIFKDRSKLNFDGGIILKNIPCD